VKRFFKSKWFKIPCYTLIVGFSIIGFGLTMAYLAIQFKWTNEKGTVDKNSRSFEKISNKYESSVSGDSLQVLRLKYEIFGRISVLKKFYPKNANQILHVYDETKDVIEVSRMLDAADLYLKNDEDYKTARIEARKNRYENTPFKKRISIYEWMNMSEWEDFKIAVAKDHKMIDSVSEMTGVEARLIVSCLVGEQIRLFNSDREAYKKWIGPLKILSVESKFSLGVTGIKELTAQKMEDNLKDSLSIYYLGKKYEQLLDFKTEDIMQERFDRLTSFRNHFYSYMYAAVFVKQVKVQWERKGFPIENRPEILATLFNVGYPQSVPKKDPKVGGSTITIKEKKYTFGNIAYQFYYSGELFDLFPIQTKKFDWIQS
jgi:hypothetical protein